MPKGFNTYTTHTLLEGSPAAIRPEVSFAPVNERGQTDLSKLDSETVASRYLKNALDSDEMPEFAAAEVDGKECEFKSLGVETILLTNTRTVKYRQYFDKIPVYGSLVTVELDENNELVSINSALGTPANVDPVATVSPAKALQKVSRWSGRKSGEAVDAMPRLHYYYDQNMERWRLVYIVEDVSTQTRSAKRSTRAVAESALPEVFDYLIDAHSGELVDKLPRTQTLQAQIVTQEASDALDHLREVVVEENPAGRFRLSDQKRNVYTHDFGFRDARYQVGQLPGDLVVRTPLEPWLPEAISAHANAAAVADFLTTVLLRDGLDNRGGAIISSINCVWENVNGRKVWKNAAWWKGQMIYGQRCRNDQSACPDDNLVSYAVASDIVAHELFHGVTEHTARLEYLGETGALNESYSDIFGIIVANIDEPDVARWNWEMGEDLSLTGVPLRDISNPRGFGDPDHMRDFKVVAPPYGRNNDWGGVHHNSGIHNKAAFNLLTAKDQQGDALLDPLTVAKLFYSDTVARSIAHIHLCG